MAVVIAAAGAFVQQTIAYAAEKQRLFVCLRNLQDGIAKARAASRKLDQFRQELVRLEQENDLVRALLPEALSRDAFEKSVADRAARFGLETRTTRYVEDTATSPQRGELAITLTGSPDAIERFLAAVPSFAPVAVWKEETRSEGGATVTLRTYALPMPPSSDSSRCFLEQGRLVWLWPHTAVLRGLRVEVERASVEAGKLEPIRLEVDRYERVRSSIDRRLAVLKSLTGAGR